MISARRLAAFIICSFGVLIDSSGILGQVLIENDGRSRDINASRPVAGRIIVSISQGPDEPNYFGMSDNGKVSTRFDGSALSQLEGYGIKEARKTFHRGMNATYELTFDAAGREGEIIAYLRSMPNVRYAQRDYIVEWLSEPNDFYYQPDSLAPLGHWIPDTLNVKHYSTGLGRTCPIWYQCCPLDSLWYHSFQLRDSLHLPDNWYHCNTSRPIEHGTLKRGVLMLRS